jgi:bacillithiol biosynthesis deacetylase BshB1
MQSDTKPRAEKLDILVIVAHPDDAELGCAGTILSHVSRGYKVGVVDLTAGELGTNGSADLRAQEAAAASALMGLSIRENLGFRDGFFVNDEAHQLEVIRLIRKYKPSIVITNAIQDRHVDHGRGAQLVADACFLSGLKKIETLNEGQKQDAWRPANVYHIIQSNYIEPDFVVDISDFWEQKQAVVRAYGSQFYIPGAQNEPTFISTPEFWLFLEGRAREFGQSIRTKYGEGFTTAKKIGVSNLFDLY